MSKLHHKTRHLSALEPATGAVPVGDTLKQAEDRTAIAQEVQGQMEQVELLTEPLTRNELALTFMQAIAGRSRFTDPRFAEGIAPDSATLVESSKRVLEEAFNLADAYLAATSVSDD